MSHTGIQVCFCGPDSTALPAEPLGAHDHFCLIWDWAMAHRKISPRERLAQLEGTQRELGISDEEMVAEEATMHRMDNCPIFPLYRPHRIPYRKPAPMGECYRASAGFMVHVKPGCRCPK